MIGLLTRAWRRSLRNSRVSDLRRSRIGEFSEVDPTTQVYGWKNVRIGRYSILCEGTLINAMNRVTDEITLDIGDHCFIGRENYFNTGRAIRIGDYCLTANNCRFLGSSHDIRVPTIPYLARPAVADEEITVGPNCWLGDGATVLASVTIGYGSIVGAATVVTKDVPPYSIVVGNPGRVVKRYSPSKQGWVRLEDWDPAEVLPEESSYLEALRREYPTLRGPLVGSARSFGDY